MFRLIIAGSRTFNDYGLLRAYCDMKLSRKIAAGEEIEIVSGACPSGADALGEHYAIERGYKVKRFPADWQRYGKVAGPMRNREMAMYADACIVFWDGSSRGSVSMMNEAKTMGIPLSVKKYGGSL